MQQDQHPRHILKSGASDYLATFKTPTDFLSFSLHALNWVHSRYRDNPASPKVDPHYFIPQMMENLLTAWTNQPTIGPHLVMQMFEEICI